jgi:hypothetical protein
VRIIDRNPTLASVAERTVGEPGPSAEQVE